jgi:hypothetical protein
MSEDTKEISRIAFRAPPFWDQNPKLWFLQLESQFKMAGITVDDTKFHAVISVLDAKVMLSVSDLIESPPEVNLYDSLKNRILDQFSKSDSTRLRLLLQDLQLGDRKPSQLLQEMRNLAAGDMKDDVMKNLWLQRLPVHAQQILSVSNDTLDDLSKIADKISDVTVFPATVSQISYADELSEIKKELADIKRKLSKLDSHTRSRSRSKDKRLSSVKGDLPKGKMCWYHRTFSEKASKCVKPCEFRLN